jgi:regulatory protein
MRITGLSSQQKDKNRVNVMVDGKYRFSLDIFQVAELGLRVGKEYDEETLVKLEVESQFGKTYARALEFCLMRPHSSKEVRDYLYRKTRDMRTKTGGIKKGVSPEVTKRVFNRLAEKGYVNDEKFARYWVENRNLKKGVSKRKLQAELQSKGVDSSIIERLLAESDRSDDDELAKIIHKKRHRYPDRQKFMMYLARQGFDFDTIKRTLAESND